MLIILALITQLFFVFASCVRQPEAATAEVIAPIAIVEAMTAAVEIFIGGVNAVGRRMAVPICAIGTVNCPQTAAPPE